MARNPDGAAGVGAVGSTMATPWEDEGKLG